jgi:hypothetical protein
MPYVTAERHQHSAWHVSAPQSPRKSHQFAIHWDLNRHETPHFQGMSHSAIIVSNMSRAWSNHWFTERLFPKSYRGADSFDRQRGRTDRQNVLVNCGMMVRMLHQVDYPVFTTEV